jgi:hypothetical protein
MKMSLNDRRLRVRLERVVRRLTELEFAGLGIVIGALLDEDSGLNSRLGDGFVRSLLKIT